MVKQITISGRKIGEGEPCFVIAEAGVNHNGDTQLAMQLLIAAKEAGADCVKFQTFQAENLVTQQAPKAEYQLKTTNPHQSQFDMLKGLELPVNAYEELFALAKNEEIICLSTPYNVEDIDFLVRLGVPALKIASGQLVEHYFLERAALTGLPLILSTGMATMTEVAAAVECVRATGNHNLMLLQCTTNYPSRIHDANLRAMGTLSRAFNLPAGYSDHTEGIVACLAAVALGATVLEKHFTLDHSLPGPDHVCSSDPAEFAALTAGVRHVEAGLGTAEKIPTETELKNSRGMRRSIVARRRIARGTVLTHVDLGFKRPTGGLSPALYSHVVGRRARVDIEPDTLLRWEHLD